MPPGGKKTIESHLFKDEPKGPQMSTHNTPLNLPTPDTTVFPQFNGHPPSQPRPVPKAPVKQKPVISTATAMSLRDDANLHQ